MTHPCFLWGGGESGQEIQGGMPHVLGRARRPLHRRRFEERDQRCYDWGDDDLETGGRRRIGGILQIVQCLQLGVIAWAHTQVSRAECHTSGRVGMHAGIGLNHCT